MMSPQLMKKYNGIFAVIGMILLASAKAAAVPKNLRWNQLQVSTTVQSYHQAPSLEVLSLLSKGTYNLGAASQIAVSFTHLSLKKQLEMGIRGFEFSLNSDYKGGAFNQNAAVKLAGGDGSTVSPDLDVPGFKMFTEVDLDFGSSCYLLAKGFQIVKDWSDKNPGHLPFVIVLHSGSGASAFNTFASAVLSEGESALETMPGSPYNFTLPDPVSSSSPAGDLVAVERIVSSIFGSTLLTPAELIAMSGNPSAQTLNEAVLPPMGQWPEVKHLLGKVAVVLDPDYTVTYSGLYPGSLVSQSVMFLCDDGEPSGPNVVFLDSSVDTNLYNASSGQLINGVDAHVDALAAANKALVERGFIVRTGLERLNVEAYFDYTYKRTQFAASGAQYLMTYNEVLPTLFPTTYEAGPSVMFGGKAIGKCNPVTSSKYCKITKG